MTNTTSCVTASAIIMAGILAMGCGSSNTTIDGNDYTDPTGGSAGAEPTETGGEAGSGNVEETGGTIASGGTGGTTNGGAGTTTGGTESGTGGNGVCTPKTCLTIAVELAGGQTDPLPEACGLVDDGCGNLIDCGGCSNGSACGFDITYANPYHTPVSLDPNLCGTISCLRDQSSFCEDGSDMWHCATDAVPDKPNCSDSIYEFENVNIFCCDR